MKTTTINNRSDLKKAQSLFVAKYNAELAKLTKEFRMLMNIEQDSDLYSECLPYKNRLLVVRARIEKLRAKLTEAQNMV